VNVRIPTTGPHDRLRDRLITLAGTPDDSAAVATDLITIAQLAADLLSDVSYASISKGQPYSCTTVAAGRDLAVAVDQAQCIDDAGGCPQGLADGRSVADPDIAATMAWPGFQQIATKLGLQASLSIPLFAGQGTPVAALNLYGRRPEPMRALSAAVSSTFEGVSRFPTGTSDLDSGGHELIAGLAGAFAVRAVIQQSLGVVMATAGVDSPEAYAMVRSRAAEAGISLAEMAGLLTSGQR
jgi:hypothetical protein